MNENFYYYCIEEPTTNINLYIKKMNKTCMECGESFKGRADKKFCSDMCRNSHNNKLNSDTNNYVRNLNNILRRNRRILEEFTPVETAKATRNKLNEKGFNFNYFTNTLIAVDFFIFRFNRVGYVYFKFC